jgi:SAM-dependent methyltransferase
MQEIVDHKYYRYKTYASVPTSEELSDYYGKKYFQNNSNYAYQMSPVEIEFKRAGAAFLLDVLENTLPQSMGRIVEVGAGEGFFLAGARDRGLNCVGVDFTTAQLFSHNASLKPHFIEATDPINTVASMELPPTCIVLRHVIEHVPDAVAAVQELSGVLNSGGTLVIEAPYDFKPLQAHVMSNRLSDKEYWLSYPDHLSYFSPDNLGELLADYSFAVRECYGDFPIELLLLSKKFNYQMQKEMGKAAHLLRCEVAHYLYENTPYPDLLSLYRAYAACKIGRSFTVIAERIPDGRK